ncbi:hypothetical protein K435DRAFT_128074 [Dendrothele bispora CBS 962.96]|uniref:Uncharacterized protein n=1 Tax=Dendrothele bispora (strain CBS 962.96) TaxID=1314807 RepID=A0A4S8M0C1_DENBC|nr:hypothetical protein K435DRAFT_128074 [Dendrothele bispora CBS 962.96]
MKQAQLDCQRQIESSNTSVTGLSLQLKQKFAMEMSKRGSRWHYLAWNNANPDFVCSACELEGLECSISEHLVCIPCRRRQAGCSRKFAEARWRTMKVLELDDQTFDTLLAQATIVVKGVNEQDEGPSGANARPTAQKRKRLSHTSNSAGHRDPQPGVRVSSRPSIFSQIKRTEKSVSNPQPPSRSTASTLVTRARPTASSVSVVMPRLPGRPPIDPDKKIKRLQEQLALVNAHNTELRKELRALNHRPPRASVDEELQAKYDEAVQDLAEAREELIEATQKNHKMTKEHETEKAALVQQQIAEHANISILRTRLRQLTDLFEEGKYSRDDMVGTCRNLCGQLQEVADRHLTQIPLGFSNILGAMTFADSGHEEEPPARRRRI